MKTKGSKISFYNIKDLGPKCDWIMLYYYGTAEISTQPSRNLFKSFLEGFQGTKYDFVTKEQMITYKAMSEHLV
jgi:hypothetical protein